ncbi:MAG: UvrB/UvrC motif-containing protein [Opitutales bacterium]
MGDSLHCDVCGKPATVHLTQIVKNQIQKVDLCEECAQTKGVTDPEGFSLAELLTKSFPGGGGDAGEEEPGTLVCEQCGCTARDLKKNGRLGCAGCYEHLRPIVLPLLAELRRVELRREIEVLEQQLLEAVQNENFESAAQCRDRLGVLRAELGAPAVKT